MRAQHIIIIGAGIVGASITHRLSRTGVRVTVIDAFAAPGFGVSAASFGWITCAAGDPDSPERTYRARLEAIDSYKALDEEFGGQICTPSYGALVWGADDAETIAWARRHQARGSAVRLVARAELAAIEPLIATPPAVAAHFPRERAVDVQEACALLLRSACEGGAQTVFGQKVLGVEAAAGRITGVRLADRIIAADQVVVAAGTQSPSILGDLMPEHGVSMSSAALISLRADAGRFAHILDGSGLEIRSRRNGELIVASDVEKGHQDQIKAKLADEVLGKVRRLFPALANVHVTRVDIAQRPILDESRPLVSAASDVDGLFLAVSHPGVIIAPEIARRVIEMALL